MLKLSRLAGRQRYFSCGRLLWRLFSSFHDTSSPPSPSTGLRDHNISQMFGVYEDVMSIRIHYLRQGVGAKNILLFPGPLGSGITDYMDFLRRLSTKKFTAIAFDPPGCGLSIPPARDWSDPEVLLQDARVGVTLMHQLGHLPFSCVGWSEGAQSALLAASELNFDDSIQSLVVWCLDGDIAAEDRSENGSRLNGRTFDPLHSVYDLEAWPDSRRLPLQALYGKEYLRDSWKAYVEAKMVRRMRSAVLHRLPQRLRQMPILHIGSPLVGTQRHVGADSQSAESALLACPGCQSTVWPDCPDIEQDAGWLPHKLHADFFQSCVEKFLLESTA
ncbi:unnamed protein product [Schistocephalus solidus]|uniref:AB hydrolase-1 domain-containing protein n=1 Tax=Schistocephalus solidus TaxID=70667 RepID=A0A183T1Q1_SCHSO|nr:unnamed protein product [Schistocephalus solidus]